MDRKRFKIKQRISRETFNYIGQERLIKDVAHKMIDELPLDKLRLLFNLKVHDPETDIDLILEGMIGTSKRTIELLELELSYLTELMFRGELEISGELTL